MKRSAVPLASSQFIVKQTIITACLPPRVVPSASAPLDSGACPTFSPRRRLTFPPSTFVHSPPQPCWPPGKSVSGSEMCREWSLAGRRPAGPLRTELLHPTPIDILPTPYRTTFFFFLLQCDFFSPLAPFLCLTSIPSRNQHGWLDNFTGSLTPKGTPERRRGSFAPLLIQPAAPPRPLSKLCWPRWVPYPRLAAFQRWWMYTDAWNISMN